MAVYRVEDHPETANGGDSTDDQTRERMFRVWCNSRGDGAQTVLADPRIPAKGSLYVYRNEASPACTCRSRVVNLVENLQGGRLFDVTCNYSSKTDENDRQQEEEENPLARRPRIQGGGSVERRVAVTTDRNGVAITNSAKRPFLDPPEYPEYDQQLTIAKNVAFLDFQQHREYVGTTNSTTWLGEPKGVWLCTGVQYGPLLIQAGIGYYEEAWSFMAASILKIEKWKLSIMDTGMEDKNGKHVIDRDNNPSSSPQCLDGNGLQLAFNTAPIYRDFDIHSEKNFSNLGLHNFI